MSKSNEYIQLIISIIGFGVTCGIVSYNSNLFLIFVLLVLAFFIFVSIIRLNKKRLNAKSISNDNVSIECAKVCNEIHKIMRANGKEIDKALSLRQEDLMRNKRKELIAKLTKEEVYTKRDKGYLNQEKICLTIIQNVMGLDRVLLLCEQYDFRICFGKYIEKYSFNDEYIQRANIDFLGWSYILKGKTDAAEKAINRGIMQIDNYLKDNEFLTEDKKFDAIYRKIRAYRHLGSNHNVYRKKPDVALEFLYKGKNLLVEKEFNDYYKKNNVGKLQEMEAGLDYGVATCLLYKFRLKNKVLADDIVNMNYLKSALEYISKWKNIAKNFPNKHRYVKLLILENSILQEISKLTNKNFPAELKARNPIEEVDINMKEIESYLNLNIYSDESMIYYLEQKLKVFYQQVEEMM